ncbi:putative aspartate aminotransferase [Aspergillus clavatus NRRL 1]|uniref:aspartate transaminase n=1 Tax=Aspergillus clavatus (strain ATCC 1007 / CBS 513.65 / DSM 816 / NCTC 3887 / NRRL 1 / QM 1276 / 107) TaxID=344612 RepID=A1CRM0_ASPCL|nr:aspartate aminotransferase, putative [Aspergillus clavatus NRRL 1]EAW08291.1 aspartate aminotransferase, putative [Aspergillus clavatus NRRL 1]
MAPSQIDESIRQTAIVGDASTVKSVATGTPSRFSNLPIPPIEEPFNLQAEYLSDAHPDRVNLGIGVYRTETGEPWPLTVVKEAEAQLFAAKNANRHEYLPIQGDLEFLAHARDLVFGFGSASELERQTAVAAQDRISSIQTISGTGANRLGAEFLARHLKPATVWIPDPTWANHFTIWELTGVAVRTYPYYDPDGKCFDYPRTSQLLSAEAQPGDVVLLHACAHNPTGADPTKDHWRKLAVLCQQRSLIPFFDLAYQGFASGSLDDDAWPIRHFLACRPELEFCVAQSFSKSFGLYGQRTGALHVVTRARSHDLAQVILANLCHLVRGEYSVPPRGGSEVVRTVLGSEKLRQQWFDDLRLMSGRIKEMRQALYDELLRLGTPGSWDHILSQIGMFTYTGLTKNQVLAIRQRHHVYMLKSGRISMPGLNPANVKHVAQAIDDIVRTVS